MCEPPGSTGFHKGANAKGVQRGVISVQKGAINIHRSALGGRRDAIGVQVDLVAGGGLSVARPLPQSIPVEYLMDAVTASEHPDPDPRLVESNAKNLPEFGPLPLPGPS